MPYYPKSQVKTNLYTNGGEYARLDNSKAYKGFYWKNSKGDYYAGKNPQVTPVVKLVVLESESDDETPSVPKKNSYWAKNYPSTVTQDSPGLSPNVYIPKPQDSDYNLGQFERYFTKKSNQNIYYEISKESYDLLNSKDPSIKWQLYLPIKLSWDISGDRQKVYDTNRNIVMKTERDSKLPGFSKIFRKDYLQYYKS